MLCADLSLPASGPKSQTSAGPLRSSDTHSIYLGCSSHSLCRVEGVWTGACLKPSVMALLFGQQCSQCYSGGTHQ